MVTIEEMYRCSLALPTLSRFATPSHPNLGWLERSRDSHYFSEFGDLGRPRPRFPRCAITKKSLGETSSASAKRTSVTIVKFAPLSYRCA